MTKVSVLIAAAPTVVQSIMPAAAYCLPAEAQNALDTFRLWAGIVAGALAVVALIMIAIGIFANTNIGNHSSDGGAILGKLGKWIFGAVLVSAASALAAIFVRTPTDCVPLG